VDRKQFDLALKEYTKLISLDINNFQYYFDRGEIYFEKGDFVKAIGEYNIAIERASEELGSGMRYYRAKAYIKLNKYDDALQDLNNLIRLVENYYKASNQNPCDVSLSLDEYYKERGDTYLKKGDFERATGDYNIIISECSEPLQSYLGYLGLGKVFLQQKNYEAALKNLNEAISEFGYDEETYHIRAMVYEKLGNKDLAEADFRKAKSLSESK